MLSTRYLLCLIHVNDGFFCLAAFLGAGYMNLLHVEQILTRLHKP